MKTTLVMAIATVSAGLLAGCGGGSSNNTSAQTNASNSSVPAVQPELYAQKKVDAASLNQAVQQYNTTEGHYPKDLQDLVPNYIARIPDAPPGYKINYNPDNGAVTVTQQ